jgi:hypothetical protein
MALADIVDELGELKARIADLTKQETKLKAALIESGYAEIDGSLFRATVTWTERATLDSEAVRALLTPDQVKTCTRVTEIKAVRVSARKRDAA